MMNELTYPGVAVPTAAARPVGGVRLDWAATAFGAWLIGGLYLDGWAHIHNPALETFFTPWHGVLYSGYLMLAILLGGTALINHSRGFAWRAAMPAGYAWSLLGAGIFALGGLGDMVWHTLFGIEVNIEALLSPTHLILAFGGALMLTGPLRAAWQRRETVAPLPVILSLLLLLALLTFFTDYLYPFANTWEAGTQHPAGSLLYPRQAAGLASIFLQAAILIGLLLSALRRWTLPPGSLTLLLGLNVALMVVVNDIYVDTGPLPMIGVGLLAGLAGDVLLWWLKPSARRVGALRGFAFLLPVMLYALYYGALALFAGGTWWVVHVWTGAILLAGVVGVLVSFLIFPPALPRET